MANDGFLTTRDLDPASGLPAAGFSEEIGGMNLPCVISQSLYAVLAAANGPAMGYNMLTVAAANLLEAHGSDELKERYLGPMVEGRVFGTMCLSEPQAGSSLADIRTKAEPQGDGSYRLTGRKMWISGGEHDMSENIVHFVLAKIPGGPAGVKGISLFCVPRVLPDGARNDIRLMGLNHKMGNRGTVNTVLAFGDEGGAEGWLVGPEHGGLGAMFVMMNEMRIGVGLGAATTAVTGYLHALSYAKERPQGRPLTGRNPERPPVAKKRLVEDQVVLRARVGRPELEVAPGGLGGGRWLQEHALVADEGHDLVVAVEGVLAEHRARTDVERPAPLKADDHGHAARGPGAALLRKQTLLDDAAVERCRIGAKRACASSVTTASKKRQRHTDPGDERFVAGFFKTPKPSRNRHVWQDCAAGELCLGLSRAQRCIGGVEPRIVGDAFPGFD